MNTYIYIADDLDPELYRFAAMFKDGVAGWKDVRDCAYMALDNWNSDEYLIIETMEDELPETGARKELLCFESNGS